MRTSKNSLHPSIKKEIHNTFTKTISDLGSPEQIDKFLNGLLKETEYEMLTKRLAVIYWLRKGRSYKNIQNNLKVSSATIASIQQSMDDPGIKLAIKHLEADEWANQWAERFKKLIG
ncbi:Trp family transcriptional regulator [Patescibacteria group bacterium]